MTVPEFIILTELEQWGPLAAIELQPALRGYGYTRQGVAAKLVKLRDRGFVRRRGSIWRLTDRGREYLGQ